MYIEKYWGEYIGGTDDSLTLIDYLAEKGIEDIRAEEIFSDFGVDKLQGNLRNPEMSLVYVDPEGWETEIHFAIDLVTDLAALLLECRKNGRIDLVELETGETDWADSTVQITATPEEHQWINGVLKDFVSDPMAYDLSEMCSEEDMREMAAVCEELRKELYG